MGIAVFLLGLQEKRLVFEHHLDQEDYSNSLEFPHYGKCRNADGPNETSKCTILDNRKYSSRCSSREYLVILWYHTAVHSDCISAFHLAPINYTSINYPSVLCFDSFTIPLLDEDGIRD